MAYYEDIVIDQNSLTKCELCKIFIGDNDTEIEQHINDRDHTKLFMKKMMIQNGVLIDGKQVTCGVCAITLDVSNIISHIQSVPHEDGLASIKETILKDGGFLILPEDIRNQGPEINCLVCDRSVAINLNIIKSHIETDRHRRARSVAVQPLNAIFSVEDCKGDLWCKICQIYFENYVETILEHVDEDPKHVSEIKMLFLLIKEQNINIEKFLYDPKEVGAWCNKCKMEVPCNLDNLERHIRGKKHIS